jgi:hypothetical protein
MEYLQRYAKKDRLDITLRNVLRQMTKLSGIRTSEAWIDQRVANLRVSPAEPEPREPKAPVRRDAILQISGRSAQLKKLWATPEYKDKMREAFRIRWQDDSYRAKMTEMSQRTHSTPEAKLAQSLRTTALWKDDEYRAKTEAGRSKYWETDEHRAAAADRMHQRHEDDAYREADNARKKEVWVQPGYKETVVPKMAKSNTFQRDESKPGAMKKWHDSVKKANDYAAGLKPGNLKQALWKAFIILHLDASSYGVSIPADFDSSNDRILHQDFYAKATVGGPWFYPDDVKALEEKHNMKHENVQAGIKKERDKWLRSAAVLRLKGIDVDYASIPQLAWLA